MGGARDNNSRLGARGSGRGGGGARGVRGVLLGAVGRTRRELERRVEHASRDGERVGEEPAVAALGVRHGLELAQHANLPSHVHPSHAHPIQYPSRREAHRSVEILPHVEGFLMCRGGTCVSSIHTCGECNSVERKEGPSRSATSRSARERLAATTVGVRTVPVAGSERAARVGERLRVELGSAWRGRTMWSCGTAAVTRCAPPTHIVGIEWTPSCASSPCAASISAVPFGRRVMSSHGASSPRGV